MLRVRTKDVKRKGTELHYLGEEDLILDGTISVKSIGRELSLTEASKENSEGDLNLHL